MRLRANSLFSSTVCRVSSCVATTFRWTCLKLSTPCSTSTLSSWSLVPPFECLPHRVTLIQVCLYALLRQLKALKLVGYDSKVHFSKLSLILYCRTLWYTRMICWLCNSSSLDLMLSMYTSSILPISSLKNTIHHPLICCHYILHAKRHYVILVVCWFDHEWQFLSVWLINWYLVVAKMCIYEQ